MFIWSTRAIVYYNPKPKFTLVCLKNIGTKKCSAMRKNLENTEVNDDFYVYVRNREMCALRARPSRNSAHLGQVFFFTIRIERRG